MAKIHANGVGNAKGTTGVNYYRRRGGETIMCLRPGPSDERKALAKKNRNCAFIALVSMWMKKHSASINMAFTRTKRVSARNYFLACNNRALREAWKAQVDIYLAGGKVGVQNLDTALAEYCTEFPNSVYQVSRAGFQDEFVGSTGWDDTPILAPDDSVKLIGFVSQTSLLNQADLIRIVGSNIAGETLKLSLLTSQSQRISFTISPSVNDFVVLASDLNLSDSAFPLNLDGISTSDGRTIWTAPFDGPSAGGGL